MFLRLHNYSPEYQSDEVVAPVNAENYTKITTYSANLHSTCNPRSRNITQSTYK